MFCCLCLVYRGNVVRLVGWMVRRSAEPFEHHTGHSLGGVGQSDHLGQHQRGVFMCVVLAWNGLWRIARGTPHL